LSTSDRAAEPAAETYVEAKTQAVQLFELTFLTALMRRADGNISRAARMASMDRVNLMKLLRKHKLSKKT
jgi:DNA-binding NtrC family response regulator